MLRKRRFFESLRSGPVYPLTATSPGVSSALLVRLDLEDIILDNAWDLIDGLSTNSECFLQSFYKRLYFTATSLTLDFDSNLSTFRVNGQGETLRADASISELIDVDPQVVASLSRRSATWRSLFASS